MSGIVGAVASGVAVLSVEGYSYGEGQEVRVEYEGAETWKVTLTGEQFLHILVALAVASVKAETDFVRFNSATVYHAIRRAF